MKPVGGGTRASFARWHAMLPGVLALLLCGVAGACGGDDASGTVRLIIEELAAQRYGTATARYRQQEEIVLSPAAAPAWRRGLEHQDSTVREWSVDSLARIGESEDVDRIVAALDDPFRNVQEAAARSLVDVDPGRATAAFIERLSSPDPLQQTVAAQGLAVLGDAAGVPPLLERFVDDSTDDAVRAIIAQSLAQIGDPRAVPPLAQVAANAEADLALRRDAAEALSIFETEAATAALQELLGVDDAYIQEIARRAIAGPR